jgi:hypothetical protein
MRTLQSRKCTLLDAMVLIAATAFGLTLVRTYAVDALSMDFTPIPSVPRLALTVWAHILAVFPLPVLWSIALFGLGVRRPRVPLRRLVRQPGFVAAGAVALVAAIRLMGFLTLIARTLVNRAPFLLFFDAFTVKSLFRSPVPVAAIFDTAYFAATAYGTSTAVAAAWLLLAVSGRWRSEPDWLDRFGRALGAFWIAVIPFTCWWDYHVLY